MTEKYLILIILLFLGYKSMHASNQQSVKQYVDLQSVNFCNLKEASCSEDSVYSEYDSGSDYVPPSQMHSKDIIDGSSNEIFYVSDIIINEIINNDQSDIFQPSTSQVVNNTNQQGKLDNEIIKSKKILKKGYNFNAAVETSKIK